jgi:hydrogenase nickel incorporation protein HypA/HybF
VHETGIAWEILESAQREAAQAGAPLVRVGVRLGALAGVVEEALLFAFDALKTEAGAPGATLFIERVAIEAECRFCGARSQPAAELILWCPECGKPMRVVEGEQMEMAWIEVDQPGEVASQ